METIALAREWDGHMVRMTLQHVGANQAGHISRYDTSRMDIQKATIHQATCVVVEIDRNLQREWSLQVKVGGGRT